MRKFLSLVLTLAILALAVVGGRTLARMRQAPLQAQPEEHAIAVEVARAAMEDVAVTLAGMEKSVPGTWWRSRQKFLGGLSPCIPGWIQEKSSLKEKNWFG
ncbi:MAG: hypothetical protein KBH78_06735 [Candidatus Hydrogenedentes bacterium]|nr:hypothetical protein [Candidatus Hydrogenedentota bacterium]